MVIYGQDKFLFCILSKPTHADTSLKNKLCFANDGFVISITVSLVLVGSPDKGPAGYE